MGDAERGEEGARRGARESRGKGAERQWRRRRATRSEARESAMSRENGGKRVQGGEIDVEGERAGSGGK